MNRDRNRFGYNGLEFFVSPSVSGDGMWHAGVFLRVLRA